MASFNRVILVGNLTRDPELKYTAAGMAICPLGLAVNDRVKRGDNYEEETTFVDITFFGRTAEVIGEYCQKGQAILVEGRLKLEQWEKDGQKRSKLCVIGNTMQMLSRREGDAGGRHGGPPPGGSRQRPVSRPTEPARGPVQQDFSEDEVPF